MNTFVKQILGIVIFVCLLSGGFYGFYKYQTTGRPYGAYEFESERLHFGFDFNQKVSWRMYPGVDEYPIDANGEYKTNNKGQYIARFQHLIDPPKDSEGKGGRYYREIFYTLDYNKKQDNLRLRHIKINIKRNIKVQKTNSKVITKKMIYKKSKQS
jgi:hypothetical protein